MLEDRIVFYDFPERRSVGCQLAERVQKMSTGLYLDGFSVGSALCIPFGILEFLVSVRKDKLSCIIFEIDDYRTVVIKQDRIRPEPAVYVIRRISYKQTRVSEPVKYGIHYPDNSSELFVLMSICLIVQYF